MEKQSVSSRWKLLLVGGCATLALCGGGLLVAAFLFAWSVPAVGQPIYHDSQPSYQSVPLVDDPAYAESEPLYEITPEIQSPAFSEPQPALEAAPQQAPLSVPQGSIRPELVGHWRYTDVLMSGDFTLVTDYHMIFGPDGMYASYYVSSVDGQIEDYVEVAWSATENTITFAGSDGSTAAAGYQITDGYLLFDGSDWIWERIE